MDDGQDLWLTRATPRAWLEQGKKIAVNRAPTYLGTVAYEILSDGEKRENYDRFGSVDGGAGMADGATLWSW